MLPVKLKQDSILEALCEIRFDSDEMPEIVIGRLSDSSEWKGFQKHRLPSSDIPAPIRNADQNLRFAPVVELRNKNETFAVKIGSNVVSFHVLKKYCGWNKFKPELEKMIDALFCCIENIRITRIGFRYINAMTAKLHLIENINMLNIEISVGQEKLQGLYNLNFLKQNSPDHITLIKVVAPNFVLGNLPGDATSVIDIDVYTNDNFSETKNDKVMDWIEKAHEYEKDAFFSLIPENILKQLVEE